MIDGMSAQAPRPAPRAPGVPALFALAVSLFVHLVVGTVGLFLAFLFVYGFAERITVAMHVAFLVGLAVVAGVSALLAGAAVLTTDRTWSVALPIGVWTAVFAYGTALGLGTIISLLNEDQGSVTADQPGWPFLLVVAISIVLAALGARRTAALLGDRHV